MPYPYVPALDGLRKLGSAFTPSEIDDPSAQLLALQDQRKTEMDSNINKQGYSMSPTTGKVASGFMSGANPADQADITHDIATNPLTAQAEQVKATEAANRAAIGQGFLGAGGLPNPAQEQAITARKQAAAVAQQPLDIERLKAGGLSEVERMKEQAASERYNLLLKSLQPGGPGSNAPGILGPGDEIDLGGGTKIKRGLVPPINPKAEADLQALETKRNALNVGGFRGLLNQGYAGLSGGQTPQQQKDDLDRQIDQAYANLGRKRIQPPGQVAPVQPGAGAVPPQVIQALQPLPPGRHTLANGSIWMKDAQGNITPVSGTR